MCLFADTKEVEKMNTDNGTWNISMQQIRIFLKAAELKNFTQAANHLMFTPSMISKTITAMEDTRAGP